MGMKNVEDFYPLSPMQQGMLFHSLYAPDSGVYIGQLGCTLRGDLDVAAFERAWQRLVERHPILRTAFLSGDLKEPVQVVHRRVAVPLDRQDWRDRPPDVQAARLDALLLEDQHRGFSLTAPPLLRLTLLQTADDAYHFVWTYHHLLFDGWSLPLLLQEVFALYEAFQQGRELTLPPLRPFRQYIGWLKKQSMAEAEAFWRRTLAGFSAPTPLVVDRVPDQEADASAPYLELGTFVSAEATATLQALARQHRLTLNTLVQGAWALLLSRYSGEEDVLFGATVSGRPADLPGAERMIGLFINTLPVRVRVAPDARVLGWLADLQAQQAELRQYEYSPLVQIQGWSEVPRGTPLFESILVFESYPVAEALHEQEGALTVGQVRSVQQTNFPLTVVAEPGEQINLRIAYDGGRFDGATIERMLGHLRTLLEGIAATPDGTISALPLLTEAERRQALVAWNATARPFPLDRCVYELFQEQAARTPDAVAVLFEDTKLTYRELNVRANQLAHYLRRLDVGPDVLVGLCVEPSLELVVGVLGVLKAGGAYVPLDPTYPAERLQYMLEDAQVAVLLTSQEQRTKNKEQSTTDRKGVLHTPPADDEGAYRTTPPADDEGAYRTTPPADDGQRTVIDLEGDWEQIAQQPAENPDTAATPDDLAYVIYTSGSTGRPKGTLLQHRGLCNLAHVVIEKFEIGPASQVLQFASFSFDASVSEILPALLAGATLVMARRETLTSIPDLVELLRQRAISVVTLPPSLLAALPAEDLPALRTVVSAGEACPWEVAERWAVGRRFLNGYGPTEATIGASYYHVTGRVPGTTIVPIGGPVANAQMFLLDRQGRPVPIAVPGELHIGGVGLARGYLNRPELTEERFIPNPFIENKEQRTKNKELRARGGEGETAQSPISNLQSPISSRLYKTGDLARYLPDGNIEFLGRVDDQVKLRGFRIELGEIEAAIGQHPDVQAAAVVVREEAPGQKRLVAYIVPGQEQRTKNKEQKSEEEDPQFSILNSQFSIQELRAFLKERLPDYMIPAAFVLLDALPLTPNGKVDRKALAAREGDQADRAHAYTAPRTPVEEILAGIWAQLLGVAQVSVEDSFFELGGHSLLATQLVSRLRDTFKVEVSLRTLFEAPTLEGLAEAVERARLQALGVQAPPITPAARNPDVGRGDGALPLSFAQQRLWFLDQLEPGSPLYNIPAAARLNGALDLGVFQRCLDELADRHEILRTTIATVHGRPQQVIDAGGAIPLAVVDLRGLAEQEREAEVRRRAAESARQPFDLERGPLLRVALLRLGDAEHVVLFTMHHIISDGWSMGVLIREIAALYDAFAAGRPSPLPALALQYADFAAWQRGWLHGAVQEQQLAYWKQRLAGSPPLLTLPTDRPRPAVQTYQGAYQTFALSKQVSEQLKALSRREGATLFMTLLAALQALLARYSGQDDISVGTTIANRNRAEIEPLIGFFVNTLVLRADLSGDPSFRELLKQAREAALGAYAHQDLPFEMIVDALQPDRNLSYTPLFQVMFALQNTPIQAQDLTGLTMRPEEAHSGTAKFDLTLEMSEVEDEIAGSLEYNTDLFDDATIGRMIGHFETLLAAIAVDHALPVSALPLLTEAERRQLLVEWNAATGDYPHDRCIHQLVEEQAARTPGAVALVFEGQRLTYAELNVRANQLAHHLQSLGVGPETLVALCLDRSLDLVVAILGVLKAGGAYLPLDLAYPPERLAFMLEDAQVSVLLTTQEQRTKPVLSEVEGNQDQKPDSTTDRKGVLHTPPADDERAYSTTPPANHGQPTVIELDADWPTIAQQPATNPESAARPDNLAYVIYTSGSTGKPKGVQVTHANVVRLFAATQEWYHFDERDVWTLFHSYAFDFSVWELWGALLYGGRLVVVPYLVSRSPEAFYELLADEQVTVLNQTPSAFRQLIRAEQAALRTHELALRYVIFGGEALEFQSLRPWFERHGDARPQLVNMYGITETTVHVTYRPLTIADLNAVSGSVIGVRIPDLQVYVLDQQRQPVPIGVPGELYVGGAGVARGYLNRPELTEERFIPSSWSVVSGQLQPTTDNGPLTTDNRLYKTGDLARFLPNGDIEYLGRIDHQVKIRGFRIELGEIEALLGQAPGVRETFVLVREDTPGDKRLVAYIVPGQEQRTKPVLSEVEGNKEQNGETPDSQFSILNSQFSGELRAFLKQRLPDYMVPSAFVLLDALPLTPNGKVDRKALPAPAGERPALESGYVAPSSPEEELLAGIWVQVLGVKQVGVYDNFFALGGDSILSIQVIALAGQAGLRLTPRQFFQHPTIAGLAAVAGTTQESRAEQAIVTGPVPLTPIQHWFFEHHPLEPQHWNTSIMLEVAPGLDSGLLERAVQHLLTHHDALRLRFRRTEAGWEQTNAPLDEGTPFHRIELAGLPWRRQRQAIEAEAAALQRSLDLAAGPLLRVAHFNLGERRPGRLLIIFHHLVIDGVSLRIVLADLMALYQHAVGALREAPALLPSKTTSFQAWSRRLAEYAQSPALRQELEYWRQVALRPAPPLPVDHPGGANTYGLADRVYVSLEARETRALLQEVPAAYGTRINDVLLAALALTFARWTGHPQLLVELDSHGRQDVLEGADVSRTVGWFTAIFPVLLDIGGAGEPGAALRMVQEQLGRVPNQGIGYGLLRYLSQDDAIRAQMGQVPQPEVNFNYLGQFDNNQADPTQALPFRVASEPVGAEHHPHGTRSALLYVVGTVAGGQLDLMWSYSTKLHKRSTIERLAQTYIEELSGLIAYALS